MTIMTRRAMLAAALLSTAALAPATVSAQSGPRVGSPAPAFSAVDSNGKQVSLADYGNKTVVLEWTNDECPFVVKHYGAKNMQALQKKWTDQGVVWLSVVSSSPGEQGFVTPEKANKLTADRGAAPTAVLLDPKGSVGRIYGAQTTPHMYIIKNGTLAYMGGIDDKPSSNQADIKDAKNFVDLALTELKEGKPVSVSTARPYGCTVKYSS
jgi:peroxiredoxin